MSEDRAKEESTEAKEARIKGALLEAYTTEPEPALRRREQLEAVSLYDLRDQRITAIERLHEKLKQDRRAVKISNRSYGIDNWQLTLPPVDSLGPVTIQASAIAYDAGAVRIYTGAASELLTSEPDSDEIDYGNYTVDVVIATGASGTMGSLGMEIAHSSIRDMQDIVESVLLLEALGEQLIPATNPNVASQAGEISVRTEQS